MGKYRFLFDTDILINWLTKEENLWEAPLKLIKLHENGKIEIFIGLLSLFELRFVLRRKKKFENKTIEEAMLDISSKFSVSVPDSLILLKANELQSKHPLDPFDSILLALAKAININALITRDREFRKISETYIKTMVPEEALKVIT
ncbi:MAG: PIN domain-containing protein [Methanomicrobia archaeon]|nr:PIN domain-containing protein [Methanomicrobia archaeon]